jgi:hypothetical protein
MTQDASSHRSFATLISDLEDGELHADLSRAVQNIVGELQNIAGARGGKPKATLTLKLDITLDSGMVVIAADVAEKLPRPVRGKSFLYATPENNLTRRNPRQPDLPFRDVTKAAEPARSV